MAHPPLKNEEVSLEQLNSLIIHEFCFFLELLSLSLADSQLCTIKYELFHLFLFKYFRTIKLLKSLKKLKSIPEPV